MIKRTVNLEADCSNGPFYFTYSCEEIIDTLYLSCHTLSYYNLN